MFKKFWGKNFLINHYKLLIVSSERSEQEKINIFKHLKMDKIPQTTQIFSAKFMKFPDLEEKPNFPDFSLTSGHPGKIGV